MNHATVVLSGCCPFRPCSRKKRSQSCAQVVLDTTDIVRDRDFSPTTLHLVVKLRCIH